MTDSISRLLPERHGRRLFGRICGAAAVSGGLAPQSDAQTSKPPSDRISLGIIGMGSRGFNLLEEFLKLPDCQVVAVCDVDALHHRDQPWGKGRTFGRKPAVQLITTTDKSKPSGDDRQVRVYSDYRDLISQPDIDAVVVATPDHWHALCTCDALQQGKDVYCEKPVAHLFAEGQTIVSTVAQKKAVFQTGSQQRSDPLFQRVVELSQNGVLGEIHTVEVGLPAGYDKPMGSTQVVAPREDLDYDFWCGPAEKLPLMQARHHRWWRGHRAFGGGVLMDWIGHHNDIAHWAIGMERSGPVRVEALNWSFPDTDVYNTPQHYTIRCEYSNGVTSTISSGHAQGVKIIGSNGWVYAKRGKMEASDNRWLSSEFDPGPNRIANSGSHTTNFLHNVRTRGECIAPAEIGHRSITPGHLGYVSQALRQPLTWDPATETIVGHSDADDLLKQVQYRIPWQLPIAGLVSG